MHRFALVRARQRCGDHERLADCIAACVKRGANVLLSNSDTPESRRIFGRGQWELEKVSARRSINSKGDGRGAVGEILVTAPKRSRKVVK
jgi:DNA adenine methylase